MRGEGVEDEKRTYVVANDTTLDLLLVRERHSEEVRVDGNASSATVGRRRARGELGSVRVLKTSREIDVRQ